MSDDEIEKMGKEIAQWITENGPAWTSPEVTVALDNRTGKFVPRDVPRGFWYCPQCDGPEEWHETDTRHDATAALERHNAERHGDRT